MIVLLRDQALMKKIMDLNGRNDKAAGKRNRHHMDRWHSGVK